MRILILLAAFLAAPAWAEEFATDGTNSARLTDKACPAAVLSRIPPERRKDFHAATVRTDGKTYEACWMRLPNGGALVVYSDGDSGIIPPADFHRAKNL